MSMPYDILELFDFSSDFCPILGAMVKLVHLIIYSFIILLAVPAATTGFAHNNTHHHARNAAPPEKMT
jgi:hypothetical protein